MEKGDLYFKATQVRRDSWRTVQEYQVFHYTDKDKLLATVTNTARGRLDIEFTVVLPGNKVQHIFSTKDSMMEFIVEQHKV